METPSSNRNNLTLSNSIFPPQNSISSSEKELLKSRPGTRIRDRSVLIDITNDSPIVGLARGSLETPISSISKHRSKRCKRTRGSGEALLRGQVKNLLQKVEEEADVSKFSIQSCSPLCSDLRNFLFPPGLFALAPKNTTQVSAVTKLESFDSFSKARIEDQSKLSQVVCGVFDGKLRESEIDEMPISRSLFLDFSEKSDSSSDCSSVVSVIEGDDASIWSIQVNVSTRDEEEVIEDYVEEEENDMLQVDELCEGISKISVNGAKITFRGNHKRFAYNNDDELVEEHEELYAADDGDYSGEVQFHDDEE